MFFYNFFRVVNHLFNEVSQAFKAAEYEKQRLLEDIQEKEREINYGEEQIAKQQESNSILSASNAFREGQLNNLSRSITTLDEEAVKVLQARSERTKAMMAKAFAVLELMEKDIAPVQTALKGKTTTPPPIISSHLILSH